MATLAKVRSDGLSKGFAILLVVLTVLPVTAPFATCDLSGILGEASSPLDASAGKLVQEAVDLSSASPVLDTILPGVWYAAITTAESGAVTALRPLVLRI